MWDRILPPRLDNDYRGHPVAFWTFIPITLLTLGRSLVHLFRADGGAQSIATIPLDSMPPDASSAVVAVFALWGLSQLLLGILYVAVLCRYRALLPLMYLLLVLEYAGRYLIGVVKPIVTLETPPGAIGNYVFVAVGIVMFLLSLPRADRAAAGTRARS